MFKCIYCKQEFEKLTHVKQFNNFTDELTCEYDVCPYCGCNEIYGSSKLKRINILLTPDEYNWLMGVIENTAYLGECWQLADNILQQIKGEKGERE